MAKGLIGRFHTIKEIGRGGMGTVYLSYDPHLQRRVAIKVLSPHLAGEPGVAERFLSEARIAASLQHPNIVTVYEAGEDQGQIFIVMEYVDGDDLGSLIKKRGALPPEEAVSLLSPIASALDYAHEKGVIHRDVKPNNILISGDGTAKLMDFGIARIVGTERLTKTGVLVGTPEYMAPELWEGKEAGIPSDLYSFAIVAYETLTGTVPFSGNTPVAVGYKHCHSPVPSSGLGENVDQIFQWALATNPLHRFPTARSFILALQDTLLSRQQSRGTTPLPIPIPLKQTSPPTQQPEIMASEKVTISEQRSLPTATQTAPSRSSALVIALLIAGIITGILLVLFPFRQTTVEEFEPVISPPSSLTMPEAQEEPEPPPPPPSPMARLNDYRSLSGINQCAGAIAISLDAQWVAAGSRYIDPKQGAMASVWSLAKPNKPTNVLDRLPSEVTQLAFSPDSRYLACVTEKMIRLWKTTNFSEVNTIRADEREKDAPLSVAFFPNSKYLVSGWQSGKVEIDSVSPGTYNSPVTVSSGARSLCSFSSAGATLLAIGSDSGAVSIYRVTGSTISTRPVKSISEHKDKVLSLAAAPDGSLLASADAEGVVYIWQAPNWGRIKTLLHNGRAVNSVVFSPDGKWLLTGCDDGFIRVFNTKTWQQEDERKAFSGAVRGLSVAQDGSGRMLVASSGDEDLIKLWTLAEEKVFSSPDPGEGIGDLSQ
ncbi:MAG: serine/threonine-protein kinase [Armatimonadetes bacterium]|nr:serine/threonine-protein kinase [Armatimonadota bacterium]MDW8121122.1 serine/threonine-protein kinase [Armatimonadota bacterium]